MKKYRITLGGKAHDVTVEFLSPAPVAAATLAPAVAMEAPAAPKPVAKAPPPAALGEPGEVRSPLAGKLVSIDVKVGQMVEEGAQVATVEAMKMNTCVFAPKSGPVAALIAKPGEAVDENDVLLIID